MHTKIKFIMLLLSIVFMPQEAWASAHTRPGIPMLSIQMVMIVMAFPLIVFVKHILLKRLAVCEGRVALKRSIFLSLIGYIFVVCVVWNILWLIQLAFAETYFEPSGWGEMLQAMTLQAPWYKYVSVEIFSISGIYLLVWYFFAIVGSEKAIINKMKWDMDKAQQHQFIWLSQIYIFTFLLVFWSAICVFYSVAA